MSISKKEASDAINDFAKLSHELMTTVVAMSEGREYSRDPEQVMQDIIIVDQKLQTAVKKLQEEQNFYDEIEALKRRILEKDKQISKLTNLLRGVERNLQHLLDTSKDNVESIKMSQKNQISVEDLVVFSQRVSFTMGETPFDQSQEESRFF